MLRVDVGMFNRNQVDSKKYSLAAPIPGLEVMGENMPFVGPVSAELLVTGSEDSITVEGLITGRLGMRCVRCLETYEYSFSVPFREIYSRKPSGETGEEIPFSGDFIDLDPEIQTAIILTLPMKPLCREDCQGLCPTCGCDLNNSQCACVKDEIDPRFSVLQDFFK